jgi:hypothetical protein
VTATQAYHTWVAAGRPYTLAVPIADLKAWAAAHGIGWLGDLGNEAHLQAAFPEDHTPFSATAWPVPLPGYVVCAIDLVNNGWLGPRLLADAKSGAAPWVKYLNYGGHHYDPGNGWVPTPSGDQHLHISIRTTWIDQPVAAYLRLLSGDPVTIYGWDASDYDWSRGPMDLAAARRDGIDFFTHKATESTNVVHGHYGDALNRARAAGIPYLGAYVVPRTPGNGGAGSVAQQVVYFLAYLNAQTPWWRTWPGWFMQVDLEHWPYDQVPPTVGVDMCRTIQAATGKRPLLYAPRWAYGDTIPGGFPLWQSSYVGGSGPYRQLYPGDGSAGWAAYSGQIPAVLQFSSAATIGTQPGCDINAFRGTPTEFARLIGVSVTPPAPTGEPMLVLMTVAGDPSGQVYICDGVSRRPVAGSDLGSLRYLARQGAIGPLWQDGRVWEAGEPDAFGKLIVDPPAAAVWTTADVDRVAAALAEALPAADEPAIARALRSVLKTVTLTPADPA